MKPHTLLPILLVLSALRITAEELVFREPFTLTLGMDKEHYYEQKFGKLPYVAEKCVFLVKGDSFGIKLMITDGKINGINYQPDSSKADVWFEFEQKKLGEDLVMMLTIKNKTESRIYMDAVMTIPGKKGVRKTTILPIDAGLTNCENWPHPIVQLVLENLRLKETTEPNQSPEPTITAGTSAAAHPPRQP